jgi:hypothetical protein
MQWDDALSAIQGSMSWPFSHCPMITRPIRVVVWARGYFCATVGAVDDYRVSTVGLDELTVRKYIRHQEEEEKRQLDLELE